MERQRIYQWLFTLAIATFGTLLSAYVYLGLKKSDDSRVLAELQTETYQQSVRASLLFTLEISSFLETQIIPSVRLYKRCCFR